MNATQSEALISQESNAMKTKKEAVMVTVVPQCFVMNGMIFNPIDFDRMFRWNEDVGEYVIRIEESNIKSCDDNVDEEKYFDSMTNVIDASKKQFVGEKYKVAVGMQMYCSISDKNYPTVHGYQKDLKCDEIVVKQKAVAPHDKTDVASLAPTQLPDDNGSSKTMLPDGCDESFNAVPQVLDINNLKIEGEDGSNLEHLKLLAKQICLKPISDEEKLDPLLISSQHIVQQAIDLLGLVLLSGNQEMIGNIIKVVINSLTHIMNLHYERVVWEKSG